MAQSQRRDSRAILTRRQSQVLRCIVESVATRGFPPTVAELCQQLGCRSSNAVYELLTALEHKGYLRRVGRGRARNIQLTEKALGGVRAPTLTRGSSVPLLAAGVILEPSQLFRMPQGYLSIDPVLFPEEELFAVTVSDQGLREVGILMGDIVIAHRTEQWLPGQLVVAWVHGTLFVRYLYSHGQGWELRAAARQVPPIRFTLSDPDIVLLGRVVGLMRRYEHESAGHTSAGSSPLM